MRKVLVGIFLILFGRPSFSQVDLEEIIRLKRENEKLHHEVSQYRMMAEENEKRAQRLRYQAIAIALAEKSKVIPDREVAGLVTLQAYRFNLSHGGYTFENAIFMALTNALIRFNYQVKVSQNFLTIAQSSNTRVNLRSNGAIGINLQNGGEFSLYGHVVKVNAYSFSNNGFFLATGDVSGRIHLWNLQDLLKPPMTIEFARSVKKIEFATDDTHLRVSFSKKEVRVFQLSNEEMASRLEKFLTRNFTKDEWNFFVSPDLPWEKTVLNRPMNY